jgi:glycosyltransferase involved in cell wall biosynthesis
MKLTVIIPVYNEASTFSTLLERVLAVPVDKEVLVVDDASDEETAEQLRDVITGEAQLFTHAKNAGKGAAIRTALQHAKGDVIIIQDADLEYFPEDYAILLKAYRNSGARAVYGVRDLGGRSFLMRFGNNFLTWLTNLFFRSNLHDMETCYKMIDRRLMQSLTLKSRRFEIEEEGKKLSPLDGLPALATLLKYRLGLPEETNIKQIESSILGVGALAVIASLVLVLRAVWPNRE